MIVPNIRIIKNAMIYDEKKKKKSDGTYQALVIPSPLPSVGIRKVREREREKLVDLFLVLYTRVSNQ